MEALEDRIGHILVNGRGLMDRLAALKALIEEEKSVAFGEGYDTGYDQGWISAGQNLEVDNSADW